MSIFTRTIKHYEHNVTVANKATKAFETLVVHTEDGKLKEIAEAVKEKGADYVLISVDSTVTKKQRVKVSLEKLLEVGEVEDLPCDEENNN